MNGKSIGNGVLMGIITSLVGKTEKIIFEELEAITPKNRICWNG